MEHELSPRLARHKPATRKFLAACVEEALTGNGGELPAYLAEHCAALRADDRASEIKAGWDKIVARQNASMFPGS